jgi:nucleoside-diphosphate-sugar epimerase
VPAGMPALAAVSAVPPRRRVVVLGGGGFLGSGICEAFAAAGWDVLSLSRSGTAPAGVRARRLEPDSGAGAEAALAAVLLAERPDTVVNAAGAVWHATERQMVASNVVMVEQLVSAAGRLDYPVRLVQLGTIHEHSLAAAPAEPVTPYARTKAQATRAVLAATGAGAVEGVVLRVANVLGPGTPDGSLFGGVLGRLAEAARERRECVLDLPPLDEFRDFVDARDVSGAVVRAADAPAVGRTLDLGRGEAVRVGSLVADLVELSGVPTRVMPRAARPSASGAGNGRPGSYRDVDPAAAWQALDWKPSYTPHDALTTMWHAVAPPTPR